MNLIIRPVIIIAKMKNSKKKTFSNILFIELACYRGKK